MLAKYDFPGKVRVQNTLLELQIRGGTENNVKIIFRISQRNHML